MTGKAQIITPDRSDTRIAEVYDAFDYLKKLLKIPSYRLMFFLYEGDNPGVKYERSGHNFTTSENIVGLCWNDQKFIFLNLRLIDDPTELFFVMLHEMGHTRFPHLKKHSIETLEWSCDVFATFYLAGLGVIRSDLFRDGDFIKAYERVTSKYAGREYGGYT